jgi:hypothetical protein
MSSVADKIDLTERYVSLQIMLSIARYGPQYMDTASGRGNGTPPKNNQFSTKLFTRSTDYDFAFRNVNRWYDRCVAALRLADRKERVQEMARIDTELKGTKAKMGPAWHIKKELTGPRERGEMLGNMVILLLLPAFDKVANATDRIDQSQRNLHLAFALAAYQRDNGRYPDRLDELAPKCIDKIPDDLFSGKPLIYRLQDKGYLLYSVGQNGIDDGGLGYDDQPRGDDLAIAMPVPEPTAKQNP